jgi:protocatechuate 3,4-dioxygenase beta subunit
MKSGKGLSRRDLLLASAAPAALSLGSHLPAFGAEQQEMYKWALRETTPASTAGPFYPLQNKPVGAGADLTTIRGRKGNATGALLFVTGQVLNIKGKPVRGVTVEIWQANAGGRYTHPSDGNRSALDPNFAGYGTAVTDSDGRYRFKTIKPAGYPVTPGWDRAPHIHFQLTGRVDRHITQMWFPDDPLNGQDRLLQNIHPDARAMVTCKLQPATSGMPEGSSVALFNVILTNG